ncbi:hypothetical protein ACFOGJ_08760 [Marinibaculum pumilum]|uniref:Uncharacterized protein n=1 Tax=Marinibaculum pumilum TaxID=1766165 RepID=A0ABV7KY89_9PROT
MIAAILPLLTGRALPWVLGGLGIAAAAGWIWIQGQRIDGLQADLATAQDRAAAAESANAILATELDRQAVERERNEAALARAAAEASARAEARGRALTEIRNAPDANAAFSPAVGAAVRRLYGAPASHPDPTD